MVIIHNIPDFVYTTNSSYMLAVVLTVYPFVSVAMTPSIILDRDTIRSKSSEAVVFTSATIISIKVSFLFRSNVEISVLMMFEILEFGCDLLTMLYNKF